MKLIDLLKRQPLQDFATVSNATIDMLGRSATSMLANYSFNEAIKRIEEDYFRMWKMSKPLDQEGREAVWRGLQAIAEIRLKLTGMVNAMVIEESKRKEQNNG